MRLLCLSNGHGEDAIALRILEQLRQLPQPPSIAVLPIVGEGHAYNQAGFPVISAVQAMPSGGFIHMDKRQLARDLQGGLVQLTLGQIKAVRRWAGAGTRPGKPSAASVDLPVDSSQGNQPSGDPGLILAVGDIVPLLFAWVSGLPFAFVGTAKSEYYLRDESGPLTRPSWWDDRLLLANGCVYYPWEQWLMRRPNCRAVFPRDAMTTARLQAAGIRAFDLGNPMMDGLEAAVSERPLAASTTGLCIALIPGSRPPEVYHNWALILSAVQALLRDRQEPLELLAAIAPGLDVTELTRALLADRWQAVSDDHFTFGSATLTLMPGQFAECVRRSDLAIALAGTATEQFVGSGKPALIMPGAGPQFTAAFAEAQTRLLGPSVIWVASPDRLPAAVQALLGDADRLALIHRNGQQRLGPPGAARRIAQQLARLL
jgi:uncharacterized protein (TIGR03492 family)